MDDEIRTLTGYQAVRLRPKMYMELGEPGFHALVVGVINYFVEASLDGLCSEIRIELLDNRTMRVTVDGHGIPLEYDNNHGFYIPSAVLYTGSYPPAFSYIANRVSPVNLIYVASLADPVVIETWTRGDHYVITFDHAVMEPPVRVGDTTCERTVVTLTPSPEIFGKDAVFSTERIIATLRHLAWTVPGLRFTLVADGQTTIIEAPEGMADTVRAVRTGQTPLHPLVRLRHDDGLFRIDLALQYDAEEGHALHCFVNGYPAHEESGPQGAFHAGLRTGLLNTAEMQGHTFAQMHALAALPPTGLGRGLTAACSVWVPGDLTCMTPLVPDAALLLLRALTCSATLQCAPPGSSVLKWVVPPETAAGEP